MVAHQEVPSRSRAETSGYLGEWLLNGEWEHGTRKGSLSQSSQNNTDLCYSKFAFFMKWSNSNLVSGLCITVFQNHFRVMKWIIYLLGKKKQAEFWNRFHFLPERLPGTWAWPQTVYGPHTVSKLKSYIHSECLAGVSRQFSLEPVRRCR